MSDSLAPLTTAKGELLTPNAALPRPTRYQSPEDRLKRIETKELSTHVEWGPTYGRGIVCEQRTSPDCTVTPKWLAAAPTRNYYCCHACRLQHEAAIAASPKADSVMVGPVDRGTAVEVKP